MESGTGNGGILYELPGLASAVSSAPAVGGVDGNFLDYSDLADHLRDLRAQLTELGIGPGDRICSVLPDGPITGVILLALIQSAVCFPINPSIGTRELGSVLDAARPRAVLLWKDQSPQARVACAARGLPVIETWPDGVLADPIRLRGPERLAPGRDFGTGESLLLRTSGTTADGKLVPLTAANITAAAAATCQAYALGPRDRRLNIMPMFHVQGVVGSLVASLLCGSSVLCAAGFEPGRVLDVIERERVTWFSASPTMHRRILDQNRGSRRDLGLRFLRCGSGALPEGLRRELEDFYQVPVVESYGMTEAHQIASTPVAFSTGRAELVPTGSRVAILPACGIITEAPGVRGEIVVTGANVIDRYADKERAEDRSFTGKWFRTGDQGELTSDGRLLITGRLKELINRGGEKISPWEVERALLAHEAVREAMAYPVSHPELIEEIAVAVVLRPGYAVADHELRDFTAGRLAPYKVPRFIRFVSALPLNASGKPSRSSLRQEHERISPAPVGPGPSGADAPESPLQAQLARIWSAALGGRAVGVHDDFYRVLGGESLAATVLLAMVRESLGVEISHLTLADKAYTVAEMAELISAKSVL